MRHLTYWPPHCVALIVYHLATAHSWPLQCLLLEALTYLVLLSNNFLASFKILLTCTVFYQAHPQQPSGGWGYFWCHTHSSGVIWLPSCVPLFAVDYRPSTEGFSHDSQPLLFLWGLRSHFSHLYLPYTPTTEMGTQPCSMKACPRKAQLIF